MAPQQHATIALIAPNQQRRERHHSLNVGSMHPPQTQGKVQ